MITQLLLKCLVLIAVVHGLRLLGRRFGPRASAMILGLPSSTAVILLLCGRERGISVAAEMAQASLLGLVGAVCVPLTYAQAVARGWRLPESMAASLVAYFAVAVGLGSIHPSTPLECLGISVSAIWLAAYLAGRIDAMTDTPVGFRTSARWSALVRTAIPMVYIMIMGIAGSAASPSCAGLISTFPSMSTVLLIVTHLEEGPVQASRIARTLPLANLSTAAFLAAFRFGCPTIGLGWGTFFAYLIALMNLAVLERTPRLDTLRKHLRVPLRYGWQVAHPRDPRRIRAGIRMHSRSIPVRFTRNRSSRQRHFAPYIELLPC